MNCSSLATRGMRMNKDLQDTEGRASRERTLSVALWTTLVVGDVESAEEAEDAEMQSELGPCQMGVRKEQRTNLRKGMRGFK
jgi:hypothetical protein